MSVHEKIMNRKSSPEWMALCEFLLCLTICCVVAILDHDAVLNPVRLAIMLFVVITVPTFNFIIRRRRNRTVG